VTKAHLRTGLAVAGLWIGLGLVNGAQFYLGTRREGVPAVDLRDALLWQTAMWFTWAALTPFVVAAATRVPLRRAPGPIMFHVVASLLATAAWLLVSEALSGLNPRMPPAADRAFLARFAARLVPSFQFQINVLVYWGIVLSTQIISTRRRERERDRLAMELREKLTAAELHALRLQMQPHFLFNTLHAVGSLIRENDAPTALATLEQLSRMLRMTLDSGERQTVPLSHELELARLYADIQTTRFAECLTFVFDAPPEVLDVPVPSLLLQPLVENAVRHGVSKRPDLGEVVVTARIDGRHLRLTVRDNGPGVATANVAPSGRGLSITRGRLALLYGEAGRLTLANQPEGGAIATVTLPLAAAAP
jgi:signal transduction histidine kinase